MRHHYRRWLVGIAGLFVGFVSFAFAADFDPIEVDEAFTTGKTARATRSALYNTLKEVLQGTKQVSDPPVKADADRYLQKYAIPMAVDPERIRDSDKSPRNILLNMFGSIQAPNPAGRQYLLDTTLAEMTKYARGNYAPQARVQAYLILGDLNTRERTQEKPPLPSAPSFKILLDDFEKADQPDGVQSAILVGLVRHAHLNANDTTRPAEEKIQAADLDRLEKIALALLAAKNPPAGRSADGHDWLRRRAAELAGHLAATRPSPAIVNAVTAILSDRTDSAEVRLAAASSLSQIARRNNGGAITIKPLAHGIALALADTLTQRFDQIDKNREKVMTRRKIESLLKTRAGSTLEGKVDKTDPFTNQTDVMQRWVGGKVVAAWTGLTGEPEIPRKVDASARFGLYTGTPAAADKQVLDDIKKEFHKLWGIVQKIDIETPLEDEVTTLRTAIKELEAVAGGAAAAAPAANADAAPGDEPPPPEDEPKDDPAA